jgi:hypothetical protein
LAIRSFSKNAISISKIPTATSWNQNKKSSPLVTVFIHYKRTYVSLCHSLSLMPFECLQHRKNAGCSCIWNMFHHVIFTFFIYVIWDWARYGTFWYSFSLCKSAILTYHVVVTLFTPINTRRCRRVYVHLFYFCSLCFIFVLPCTSCVLPGTPAKKRTIPHFPFFPLIFKGFPAIKNLGSFRESSGQNLTYQEIVDFGSWWNSVFKCGNCGNCGNCGLIVD